MESAIPARKPIGASGQRSAVITSRASTKVDAGGRIGLGRYLGNEQRVDHLAVAHAGYGLDPAPPPGTRHRARSNRPLHFAHQHPPPVYRARDDGELRGVSMPVALRRFPGTETGQRAVAPMQRGYRHTAEFLPRIRLQAHPVPEPIAQPSVAGSFRQHRPARRNDAEPQPQERIVDPIETAFARRRIAPERNLTAHEVHLPQRRQWPRKAGHGPAESTGDFADAMPAGTDGIQQRPQRRSRRRLRQEQAIGFFVQRAGRMDAPVVEQLTGGGRRHERQG